MAFGSTITLTVNAVPKILNRVNQDNYGSEYSLETALDSWTLLIRHSTDSIDKSTGVTYKRGNVYLTHITFATTLLPLYSETVTWTMRRGKFDGTTQLGYASKGMLAYLSASSYAVIDDLVAGLN